MSFPRVCVFPLLFIMCLSSMTCCWLRFHQSTKLIAAIRICPFTFGGCHLSPGKVHGQKKGKAFVARKAWLWCLQWNLAKLLLAVSQNWLASAKCSCLDAYERKMTDMTVPTVLKELLYLLLVSHSALQTWILNECLNSLNFSPPLPDASLRKICDGRMWSETWLSQPQGSTG